MAELDSASGNGDSGSWQKVICTICFEELKPFVEELQSIPICGHVFHELCIQQWLEYCSGKKYTCPVCKQSYSRRNLTRLYFQSTGDSTKISSPYSMHGSANADALVLEEELKRLHEKLAVTVENQQSHLKKIQDELYTWKQLAKSEQMKSEKIKKEKENNELLLHMKIEELSRKTAECSKLQERSLALAKELAAFKLVTDLNLEEDEMVKLASIGHQRSTENAVDVLKKSLFLRNKSYKELMIQCNMFGRSESRASQKLDKAKEKINKLKTKLHEVEKILEEKENRAIRDLKASYKSKAEQVNSSYAEQNIKCSLIEDSVERNSVGEYFDQITLASKGIVQLCSSDNAKLKSKSSSPAYDEIYDVVDLTTGLCNYTNQDSLELIADEPPVPLVKNENEKSDRRVILVKGKGSSSILDAKGTAYADVRAGLQLGMFETRSKIEEDEEATNKKFALEIDMFDREKSHIDDTEKEMPHLAQKNEDLSFGSPAFHSGPFLSGGFVSINESKGGTGKWCRSLQSNSSSGDLIAVGADGRGGRIKVLRSQEEIMGGTAMARRSNPKRQKHETKQTNQFNIEHFFVKTQTR